MIPTKLQFGDYGCFAYVSINELLRVGDRVDLNNIDVNLNGRLISYLTSGPWYVYEYVEYPGISARNYKLIRQGRHACLYGEGETYDFETLANIYGLEVFRQNREKRYVTFTRIERRYLTLVKAAFTLKRYHIPAWDLQGDLKLFNIYSYDRTASSTFIMQSIEKNRPYPFKNNKKMYNTVGGELFNNTSETFTVMDFVGEPGTVYKMPDNSILDSDTEDTESSGNRYIIVRNIVINLTNGPNAKITTYLSTYSDRSYTEKFGYDDYYTEVSLEV